LSRDYPRASPRSLLSFEGARQVAEARHHPHVRVHSSLLYPTQRRRAEVSDTNSVCLRDAKEAFSVKPRFPEHFVYMVLDVQDTEDQNLIRLFPGCVLLLHLVSPSPASPGYMVGWADQLPSVHAISYTMRLRKVERCWYIVMVGTLFGNRCPLIN
jgi:hypothetical protein